MKKALALILVMLMTVTVFAGCQGGTSSDTSSASPAATPSESAGSTEESTAPAESSTSGKKVEIRVVTSYGGDDGNRINYENAVAAYEEATGNTVSDESGTSNEQWKAQIKTDFQTGSEPDVLFFFSGVDADDIVKAGKVVTIDEIREVYPEYASNMKDELLQASPADGKKYTVPVNGYWEAMFVNKRVLADAGLEVPGANTTWEEFMTMCQTIKDKGYTPIAASLQEVPHYWFEYTIFNEGNNQNHAELPANPTDAAGERWTKGLDVIKEMYERGFFPENTLTATDSETFQMMADDKAAFAIDGSWKVGWFTGSEDTSGNVDNLEDYTVTYVPGMGERKSTDIISGISMGYYITRKAWDDPEKREAAIKFIEHMTTDEVVSQFSGLAVTALKNGVDLGDDIDPLSQSVIDMNKGVTGTSPAVQDGLNATARAVLFASIKDIVTGSTTPADAIQTALDTPLE
ncbi:MAG: ABC transporter substrate-binding protein [Oscillospiraceae bacterium]